MSIIYSVHLKILNLVAKNCIFGACQHTFPGHCSTVELTSVSNSRNNRILFFRGDILARFNMPQVALRVDSTSPAVTQILYSGTFSSKTNEHISVPFLLPAYYCMFYKIILFKVRKHYYKCVNLNYENWSSARIQLLCGSFPRVKVIKNR